VIRQQRRDLAVQVGIAHEGVALGTIAL